MKYKTQNKSQITGFQFPKRNIYTSAFLSLGTFYYILVNKYLYVIENYKCFRKLALSIIYKDAIYVFSKKLNIILVTNVLMARIEVRNLLGFRIARLNVPGLYFQIHTLTIVNSHIYITSHDNQLLYGYIDNNYYVERLRYIASMNEKLNLQNKHFLLHNVCCSDGKCSGNDRYVRVCLQCTQRLK